MKHTPDSAAKAVRVMLRGQIAATWDEYFQQADAVGGWATSYLACKLVQEQVNGPRRDEPCSFQEASAAVARVMPELFAEYWENLPWEEK